MRLLRVHTDKVGKRTLDLENSLALMTEDKMEDFPLGAENRAVKESLTAVSDGPRTQSRYHTEWHHIANEIVSYQVKLACEEGSAIELRDKRPLRNFPLAQFWQEHMLTMFKYLEETVRMSIGIDGLDRDMVRKTWNPFYYFRHGSFARIWDSRDGLCNKSLVQERQNQWRDFEDLARPRVNHFRLLRPAMACLHSCYSFVQVALGKRMLVWNSVRTEMRLVIGLIFLGRIDWAMLFQQKSIWVILQYLDMRLWIL